MLYDASRAGNLSRVVRAALLAGARRARRGRAGARHGASSCRPSGKGWCCATTGAAAAWRRLSGDRYVWRGEEQHAPFAEWQLIYRLHRAGLPVPAPIGGALPARGLDLQRRHHHRAAADRRLARRVSAHRGAVDRHLDRHRPLHPPLSRLRRLPRGSECAQHAAERGRHGLADRLRPRPAAQARACGATAISCACAARSRRSPGRLPPERFAEADWHGLLDGYRQSSGKSELPALDRAALAPPLSSRRLPRRAAHLAWSCCGADCATAATGTTSASASASGHGSCRRAASGCTRSRSGEVQACAALVSALCARAIPRSRSPSRPSRRRARRARARSSATVAQVRYVPSICPVRCGVSSRACAPRWRSSSRPSCGRTLSRVRPRGACRWCSRARASRRARVQPLPAPAVGSSASTLAAGGGRGGAGRGAMPSAFAPWAPTAGAHARRPATSSSISSVPPDIAERGGGCARCYAPGRAAVGGRQHARGRGGDRARGARRGARRACRDALLVLAPRHPPRFARSPQALDARRGARSRAARRARAVHAGRRAVLLLDTLGELLDFYAAADVAFVGGSLVPVGGHNLLEPAALGVPILTGPHNFNSADIARLLIAQRRRRGGARRERARRARRELIADPAGARAHRRARPRLRRRQSRRARQAAALIEPLLRRRPLAPAAARRGPGGVPVRSPAVPAASGGTSAPGSGLPAGVGGEAQFCGRRCDRLRRDGLGGRASRPSASC